LQVRRNLLESARAEEPNIPPLGLARSILVRRTKNLTSVMMKIISTLLVALTAYAPPSNGLSLPHTGEVDTSSTVTESSSTNMTAWSNRPSTLAMEPTVSCKGSFRCGYEWVPHGGLPGILKSSKKIPEEDYDRMAHGGEHMICHWVSLLAQRGTQPLAFESPKPSFITRRC